MALLVRALTPMCFGLALLLAQSPTLPPAPPPGPAPNGLAPELLLVANKADHSLSIFLPAERRELATLPTGDGPHEVAIAPDGRLAVVTDYGAERDGHSLTVVDIDARKVARTIELATEEAAAEGGTKTRTFLRPHGVRFVGDSRVVVTSERARRLLLVDLGTGKVERTWPTPQLTMHMVAVSSDLRSAAATSIKDGSVVLFGLGDEGATSAPIACGEGSEGLAVQPGTGMVWVGNRAANTLSIVDPKTAKVVATLPTGDFPFRLAFTPDGSRALVTCAEAGDLMVFDAATHAVVNTISIHADGSELSAMPMGIAIDGDGKRAFVACGRGEFVATIDLVAAKVVDRLPARPGCDGIAWVRRPRAAAASKD